MSRTFICSFNWRDDDNTYKHKFANSRGGERHKTNFVPLNAHWTLREGRGGVQGVARVVDVKEKRILFRKIRGEVGE